MIGFGYAGLIRGTMCLQKLALLLKSNKSTIKEKDDFCELSFSLIHLEIKRRTFPLFESP